MTMYNSPEQSRMPIIFRVNGRGCSPATQYLNAIGLLGAEPGQFSACIENIPSELMGDGVIKPACISHFQELSMPSAFAMHPFTDATVCGGTT
jgi:hypothetical protein